MGLFSGISLTGYSSVTDECLRNIVAQVKLGLDPLKARPIIRLSQWAQENFYLSAESSQKKQKWEAYPFQIGWLDWMGDRRIVEFDCIKSARVGYTKCLLACVGYDAEYERRNQVIYQPTDDDRDSFTKTEIDPMLADTKALQKVLPSYLKRHKDNTTKLTRFLGSLLHILGGKAAKNYRRITVSSVKFDELDAFDQQVEGSADPITLGGKRLEGASYPKLIAGTTPRVKGLSHIEGRTKLANAFMRYYVPCPHCHSMIRLEWGGKEFAHGFKFDLSEFAGGGEGQVHHLCRHCGVGMSYADYLTVWKHGRWISDCGQYEYDHDAGQWRNASGEAIEPPRHVATHIWTAYSPQVPWTQIVREFYAACMKKKAGDKAPLIGFVNETLGETWEDDESEKLDWEKLRDRAENYPLCSVPNGGLVLVSGTDVQDDRFEITVWAVGRGMELWVVDYHIIEADTSLESEWLKLDEYLLNNRFTHENGQPMRIEACAIDMMGHATQQGYNFVRTRGKRKYARCLGVRGDPKPGKPISGRATSQDVSYNGQVIKNGVKLYYVGADTAKDLIKGRLLLEKPGAGYIHFSADLPDEFYKQLTAEVRVLLKTIHGYIYRWVKPGGARNEVLDTLVYALFCMHLLGLHVYTDAMWSQLEKIYAPSLFSDVDEEVEEQVEASEPEPSVSAQIIAAKRKRNRQTHIGSATW